MLGVLLLGLCGVEKVMGFRVSSWSCVFSPKNDVLGIRPVFARVEPCIAPQSVVVEYIVIDKRK